MLRATHLYLQGPLRASGGNGGGGQDSGGSEEEDDYEMVAGGGGGGVDDLPPHTRAVVAALRVVQRGMDAAVARHGEARRAAGRAAADRVRALYARRRALLLEAGAPAAPRCYWLRVLRAVDAAALAVTPRDAAVLQHLVDVRFELEADAAAAGAGADGGLQQTALRGTWELEFAEGCPQLAAGSRTLRKEYHFVVKGAAAGAAAGGLGLRLTSGKVVAAPQWAPGAQDPTHRKARDGRTRPCASFFQLFRQGGGGGKLAFNLTGVEKEVQVRLGGPVS